ncbi:unnamed protein product, partial [Cladocopium goreaui]
RGGMLWQIALAAVLAVTNARLREDSNALRNLSAKEFQGDQDFASFALCCQAQRPSDSARCDLCGRQQWPCEQLLRQQRSTLDQLPSVGVADDVTTPGIEEMRAFFEHSVALYLTGEITDPVFLDIEYVLPAIFLAVGKSKRSKRSKFEVMDVGAYAGSVSCGALAIWDALEETISDWPSGGRGVKLPEIQVTALEPSPNRCALLQGKSAKGVDGCQGWQGQSRGRLDAHCVAASFENSEAVMQCPNGMSFLADDGSQANVVSAVPCGEPVVVKTVRLDEFTKDLGIHEVDVLKVDAEGYDYNVILGASGLLESRRIRFVIFEACAMFFSCPTTESHGQMEAAVRYFASMKYVCFMMAPEMLVPLTGDWLTDLYRFSQLTFNVLCAHQKEPLMKEIIQLYSRTPRAIQFALAALASLQDPPSYAAAPRCGRSCLDPLLGDAALRQSAAQAEVFFEALHQRIVSKGWQLSHMRFVHARQLQAAGKVNLAIPIYHELQATLGPLQSLDGLGIAFPSLVVNFSIRYACAAPV